MRREKGQEEKFYSTLDAYQAGFLTLRGNSPKFIEQGNKVVFLFPVSEKLNKDLADYISGATVQALRFSTVIKSLKSKIFSLRNGQGNDY